MAVDATYPHNKLSDLLLNDGCRAFLTALHLKFNQQRLDLLKARQERQLKFDAGELPNFLPETSHIRNSEWTVAPIPSKLMNRTIEITGPCNRKMVINALNSAANGYMADFEDSTSPQFNILLDGQKNIIDAINDNISFYDIKKNKTYKLKNKFANSPTLHIRTRGLHLNEKHFKLNNQEISGSLFDFGIFFYWNHKKLINMDCGPYFYLPKLQHYKEAEWWNNVFIFAQKYFGFHSGYIRATVLIEHICTAFQMNEILYVLREHSAGLNCGRWDYIFSFLKVFNQSSILPDRGAITMKTHFMESYVKLLIQTCHARGIHAMGGMAAAVPSKDKDVNTRNMNAVYEDKITEAKAGHDGTWIAHPGLVDIALKGFNKYMKAPNQINVPRKEYNITQFDLLKVPTGKVTIKCIKENVSVCLKYMEAYMNGIGCIALNSKMEDAATAEISRIQLWNWVSHRIVSKQYIAQLISNEPNISNQTKVLFLKMISNKKLTEFLTAECYNLHSML